MVMDMLCCGQILECQCGVLGEFMMQQGFEVCVILCELVCGLLQKIMWQFLEVCFGLVLGGLSMVIGLVVVWVLEMFEFEEEDFGFGIL